MPPPPITVAVGDDSLPIRDALRALIASEDDLRLVGTAPDAVAVVELCRTACPDVVVVDRNMPGGGALAAIDALRSASPTTAVVVFSARLTPATEARLMEAGAQTCIAKGGHVGELVEAIRRVARGGPVTD